MAVLKKEDHQRLGMELVTFAKEELERRKKAPIYVPAEDIEDQLKDHNHILIFDPRTGSNQKSFRFWKDRASSKQRNEQWKTLGHRHTVEAVIYVEGGKGFSVIDGIDYPWKPGDFICVPMFAWHRHVVESDYMTYVAATTGPLSMYLGLAVYEDERYPEHWIFAQKGEEQLRTLIPGKSGAPEGSTKVALGGTDPNKAKNKTDRLYVVAQGFASQEEVDRRAGKVLVRDEDLVFESTRMGNVAIVVDPSAGFHVRTLGTLVAEIPSGKRSGAHRHAYEETNYVISGSGYSIIEDQRFDWKKSDSLCIPPFAWHQHFNTGVETTRFLIHHDRPYMENLGFLMVEHGEDADF